MTDEEFQMAIEGKQNAKDFLANYAYANLFNRIALISPIIILPALSIYLHDGWILFGILFTYLGGLLFNKPIFTIIVLIITIFCSLKYGFSLKNHAIVFLLSYLYGYITVSISKYFSNKVEKTKMKMENAVDKGMSKFLEQKQQNNE
jgi:hypothetical protein